MVEDSFYVEDKKKYEDLNTWEIFTIQDSYKWSIIGDKYALAETINNYVWQDLWAARLIHRLGE